MRCKEFLLNQLLLGSLFVAVVTAWSNRPFPSSRVSAFGGSVVVWAPSSEATSSSSSASGSRFMEMKKGKPNVPPQMRSQYKKQQEMQALRQQMIQASTPGSDGLPVFNLFVRTKRANMWYPCGSFKGDDKSAALAKSYADGGLLAGISKKQIDSGVAGSLFRDQDKLKESICRAYPQLRKSSEEFEFGYRMAFEGLSDDKKEMVVVEPKESKGLFDNIKNAFAGN